MKVRKLHPYDGTNQAGKPTRQILTVEEIGESKPHGVPSGEPIYRLSDGRWVFPWNVVEINEEEDKP